MSAWVIFILFLILAVVVVCIPPIVLFYIEMLDEVDAYQRRKFFYEKNKQFNGKTK